VVDSRRVPTMSELVFVRTLIGTLVRCGGRNAEPRSRVHPGGTGPHSLRQGLRHKRKFRLLVRKVNYLSSCRMLGKAATWQRPRRLQSRWRSHGGL